ncbi:hypothetical protein DFH06DRAFT_1120649 [Mycena polygramma]|nr:hypothetical protein DFH06DRAFT_1120649 [Mycena polygramma]
MMGSDGLCSGSHRLFCFPTARSRISDLDSPGLFSSLRVDFAGCSPASPYLGFGARLTALLYSSSAPLLGPWVRTPASDIIMIMTAGTFSRFRLLKIWDGVNSHGITHLSGYCSGQGVVKIPRRVTEYNLGVVHGALYLKLSCKGHLFFYHPQSQSVNRAASVLAVNEGRCWEYNSDVVHGAHLLHISHCRIYRQETRVQLPASDLRCRPDF